MFKVVGFQVEFHALFMVSVSHLNTLFYLFLLTFTESDFSTQYLSFKFSRWKCQLNNVIVLDIWNMSPSNSEKIWNFFPFLKKRRLVLKNIRLCLVLEQFISWWPLHSVFFNHSHFLEFWHVCYILATNKKTLGTHYKYHWINAAGSDSLHFREANTRELGNYSSNSKECSTLRMFELSSTIET